MPVSFLRRLNIVIAVFFLAGLLWYTDQYTIWPEAESRILQELLTGHSVSGFWLSDLLPLWLHQGFGAGLYGLRIGLGILPSLLFLGVFFLLGRRMLGEERTLSWLLVVMSVPVWALFSKTAALDLWFSLFLGGAFGTAILYLKQPALGWKLSSGGALLLAGWMHPLGTLMSTVVFSVLLWFFHPRGKRLVGLGWWAVQFPLLLALLFFSPPYDHFWMGYGTGFSLPEQAGILLLGVLPWIPFLLAALVDLIRNGRKREEFTLLFGSWWLSTFLVGSLISLPVLGLLIDRQLRGYQQPGYPWRNLVKTTALLHLLVAFVLIVIGMMGGFYKFGGTGFRAAMATGSVYWIASFVGVIGLYGKKVSYICIGLALAGAWLIFVGNVQLGPLLEERRSMVKRGLQALEEKIDDASPVTVGTKEEGLEVPLQWYLEKELEFPGKADYLSTAPDWLFTDQKNILDTTTTLIPIEGWRSSLGVPDTLWIGAPRQ